jgi:hypothetical protein
MVQLWKALAFLGSNPNVTDECAKYVKKKGIKEIVHTDPQRRSQPTADAIKKLDEILNGQHKLRLGLYQLSEINRWLQSDAIPAILTDFWSHVKPGGTPTDGFLEAAGVLLCDREFRVNLSASGDPGGLLQGKGFAVTQQEAKFLKDKTPSGSPAALKSEQFFSLMWSGGSCAGRLIHYSGYVHPNY